MIRILSIVLFFSLVVSCDIATKPDSVRPIQIVEENTTNTFHATPASGLAINPIAFDRLKEAKSLTISKMPQNGELKFIENGYVFYKLTNLNATSDDFKIEAKNKDGISAEEEIKIAIHKNPSDMPCYAGLIGENTRVETNRATEIDVLANDKSCGNIQNLSIEIYPKNGKVEIIRQKIVYTPNKDFEGSDIFFYRAVLNNSKNPIAPVELLIGDSTQCSKGIADDYFIIKAYEPNSELMLDVLENDKICKEYEKAELRISKKPTFGTATISTNVLNRSVIIYKTNQKVVTDTFEYMIMKTETQFIKGKITVKIE